MSRARHPSQLWLVRKRVGESSHDVVRRLRAEVGESTKLCHGGVLDPFAHGLLIVLVGATTRLFELLHEVPKTYVARVVFGAETDSLDALGLVVERADAAHLSPAALDEALARFVGWRAQVPPAMSNLRVDGERAWVRARRGELVELEPRSVYLHSASWRAHELPAASVLELCCRGGFYVRSLARDVARAAGTRAHLAELERTAIGPWRAPPEGERVVLSGEQVLPWLPALELGDEAWGRVRRGQPLGGVRARRRPAWRAPAGFPASSPLVRVLHRGRLVALLEGERVHTLLPGGV